jgi:hypothetical protein
MIFTLKQKYDITTLPYPSCIFYHSEGSAFSQPQTVVTTLDTGVDEGSMWVIYGNDRTGPSDFCAEIFTCVTTKEISLHFMKEMIEKDLRAQRILHVGYGQLGNEDVSPFFVDDYGIHWEHDSEFITVFTRYREIVAEKFKVNSYDMKYFPNVTKNILESKKTKTNTKTKTKRRVKVKSKKNTTSCPK